MDSSFVHDDIQDKFVDLKGGIYLFNKKKVCPLCNYHNLFSLFTMQIILLSKCCLFCLLSNGIRNVYIDTLLKDTSDRQEHVW